MIYFLYGTDTEKARANLHKLVDGLLVKKPNASLFKMDDETWNEGQLSELAGGQGLFEAKYIVIFDNLFRNKEAKEFVLKKLGELAESGSIFFFLEGKIDKPTLVKVEKYAKEVREFGEKKTDGRKFGLGYGQKDLDLKEFNIFSLTEALGRRDRKELWTLYTEATLKNISAEEIHGLLFWQIKSIVTSARVNNALDADMKPFTFSKARNFAKNYSEKELLDFSGDLVRIYHEAHRGVLDFDGALEKFVLSI